MENCETGTELLARLGEKPETSHLEPALFTDGLKTKALYEFYGREGSGKTQALLHLTANSLLPEKWRGLELNGCGCGVIFVDTTYHFSIIRLVAIMESRIDALIQNKNQLSNNCSHDISIPSADEIDKFIQSCLKQLHVVKCNNTNQLLITLHSLQSFIGSHLEICMLMIDSVSAFYWIDRNQCLDIASRYEQQFVTKLVDIISNLITTYNMTAFVTKSAVYEKKKREMNEDGFQKTATKCQSVMEPLQHMEFLGNKWSRLVSYRLILQRVEDPNSHSHSFYVTLDKNGKNEGFAKTCVQFKIGDSGLVFN